MSAEAPALVNPLMDPQVAEYVTQWPSAVNTGFVLTMAYVVFMMQTGFLLLTVGSVRARSARSVCVKNVADAVFGGVAYFLFGYAFAYGDETNEDGTYSANGFIGTSQFALSGTSSASYYNFVFQFAFAITAATIVSGSVAERLKFEAYCLYSFFLTAWVYPVLSHWVWSPAGWASPLRSPSVGSMFLGIGVYDTVGSGTVHMLAGVAALWGAVVVGPRRGRFDGNGKPLPFAGHNAVFYCAGCLLLWFGFYGFNGGTAYAIITPLSPFPLFSDVTSRAALSTTLGACFGGTFGLLSGLLCHLISKRTVTFDLFAAGGGTLCGMVVITSGCFFYQPWAAAVGGILGGLIYYPCSLFVLHVMKVDDPTDSFVIHAVAGALGVIWPALLADKGFVHEFYGPTTPNGLERPYGWFLGSSGKLLGANIVWILVIFGWTTAMMLPFFLILRACKLLRVSEEEEMQGVDVSKHGGSAYLIDDVPASMGKTSPTGSIEQQLAMLQDRVLVLEGAKATV